MHKAKITQNVGLLEESILWFYIFEIMDYKRLHSKFIKAFKKARCVEFREKFLCCYGYTFDNSITAYPIDFYIVCTILRSKAVLYRMERKTWISKHFQRFWEKRMVKKEMRKNLFFNIISLVVLLCRKLNTKYNEKRFVRYGMNKNMNIRLIYIFFWVYIVIEFLFQI